MTYDQYRLIFIIGAALAGLMLIAAIVLFFVLKIPRVIGELSGRTARKAIEGIRSQTEQSGQRENKTVNTSGRGKTAKIPEHENKPAEWPVSTEKLPPSEPAAETVVLAPETTILAPETTILAPETTLLPQAEEAAIPFPQAGETAQLSQPAPQPAPQPVPQFVPADFVIEYEITFVNSSEYIA